MKSAIIAVVLTVLLFGTLSAVDKGGDITPPALVAATADRYVIDTSMGAQTVTLSLHITDDLSGLEQVQINYRHEFGYNRERLCFETGLTGTDLYVQCPVEFPRFSAEGRWLVDLVVLTDLVGNQKLQHSIECVGEWVEDRCTKYAYLDSAPAVVRSMEISVGKLSSIPSVFLYLPKLTH